MRLRDMKHRRALLTALFTATFVVSPLLTAPFSGFRADQLPIPQIDPPVQPAGWAFSIWGLIYTWLVISAVYGLWKRPADADWNTAREPLLVSLAIGSLWLWTANNTAIGATVMIFVMAALAIAATAAAPLRDRWLLQVPVSILAGWLTAASFVSLGSTAAGYGLLAGPVGWAWIGIIGALCVGVIVQRLIPAAPGYGLTLVWALSGIIAANLGRETSVAGLAAGGIVVVVAVVVWGLRQQRTLGAAV
jgi:hypothetical protein